MIRFSIITCSYNCLEGLKAARAQVLSQQGVEVEHIVVDGGSSDGTREWLGARAFQPVVSAREAGLDRTERAGGDVQEPPCFQWVSEPDKGLYDALNKGLRMATGDVVGVLHCDDVWEDDRVLARVAEAFGESETGARAFQPVEVPVPLPQQAAVPKAAASCRTPGAFPDAVYGDLLYVDAENISRVRRVWRSGEYDRRKWWNGWMPPHTALFVRREAALRVGEYRLDMGSAADYEWMLRAGLVRGLTFAHLPEMLVRMRVGGASNASVGGRLRAHGMDRRAWELNGLKPRPWTLKMKVLRKIPQWLCRSTGFPARVRPPA